MTQTQDEINKMQWRILDRNGKFNIAARGTAKFDFKDLYYQLITASWARFFSSVFACYFSLNFIFAAAYFACGPQALEGVRQSSPAVRFMDCFFFSVQTLATIGYGRISPVTLLPNILVTLEALIGLLLVGLMTGLLFSRFSRSTARVKFSRRALISEENGLPCFIFRLANERLNQVTEAHLHATFIRSETAGGEKFRRMIDLNMERDRSPLFLMSWTAVHRIDETSPFFGMTDETLRAAEVEVLVSLTGVDNAFSQPLHARVSYTADDFVWNGRFADMLERRNGTIAVDLNKIDEIE